MALASRYAAFLVAPPRIAGAARETEVDQTQDHSALGLRKAALLRLNNDLANDT